MQKSGLQFTLRILLLTVAADALILALMVQAPPLIARPTLIALVPISSALVITGLVFGSPTMRAFCIGAGVPLGMMLTCMTMHLLELEQWLTQTQAGRLPRVFGSGFLASITLGYVCVGFRWIIERGRE